jgi:hypothetical protein
MPLFTNVLEKEEFSEVQGSKRIRPPHRGRLPTGPTTPTGSRIRSDRIVCCINTYQAVATRYASGAREFLARVTSGGPGDLLPLRGAAGAPSRTETGLALGRACGRQGSGSRRALPGRRLPRCVRRADAASCLPFVLLAVPRQREQIAQGVRLVMLAVRQGSAAFHERHGPQFLFDSRL